MAHLRRTIAYMNIAKRISDDYEQLSRAWTMLKKASERLPLTDEQWAKMTERFIEIGESKDSEYDSPFIREISLACLSELERLEKLKKEGVLN